MCHQQDAAYSSKMHYHQRCIIWNTPKTIKVQYALQCIIMITAKPNFMNCTPWPLSSPSQPLGRKCLWFCPLKISFSHKNYFVGQFSIAFSLTELGNTLVDRPTQLIWRWWPLWSSGILFQCSGAHEAFKILQIRVSGAPGNIDIDIDCRYIGIFEILIKYWRFLWEYWYKKYW